MKWQNLERDKGVLLGGPAGDQSSRGGWGGVVVKQGFVSFQEQSPGPH